MSGYDFKEVRPTGKLTKLIGSTGECPHSEDSDFNIQQTSIFLAKQKIPTVESHIFVVPGQEKPFETYQSTGGVMNRVLYNALTWYDRYHLIDLESFYLARP